MAKKSKQDEFHLSARLGIPKEQGQIIKKALLPELNAAHVRRSKTSITIKNTTMSININAQDASALRAAANSCLNSIILSKSILEVKKW